ncbi:MAG: hypothetical protein WAQ27_03695 [Candidatus Microsaccharimonas sp.]
MFKPHVAAITAAVVLATLGLSGCSFFDRQSPKSTDASDYTYPTDKPSAPPVDDRWGVAPQFSLLNEPVYRGDDVEVSGLFVEIIAFEGDAPYGPFNSTTGSFEISEIGDHLFVTMTPEEIAELNTNGTLCFMDSAVIQLPNVELPDLQQRLKECNKYGAVGYVTYTPEELPAVESGF